MRTFVKGPSRRRQGFTLIELLVVVAIIAVLVGLLMPAVRKVREAANRAACQNNLKQLALGLNNFETFNGNFPCGQNSNNGNPARYGFRYGYGPQVLPFIEQQQVFNIYHFNVDWFDAANEAAVTTPIKTFLCPSVPFDERYDVNAYANCGDDGTGTPDGVPAAGAVASNDYLGIRQVAFEVANSLHYLALNPPAPDNEALTPTQPFPYGLGYIDPRVAGVLCETGYDAFSKGSKIADIYDGTSRTILLNESAGRPRTYWYTQYVGWCGDATGWGTRDITKVSGVLPIMPAPLNAGTVDNQVGGGGQFDAFNPAPAGLLAINITNSSAQPYAFHPGGINVAMADGSVQWVSQAVSLTVYASLATRAGNEVLGNFAGF